MKTFTISIPTKKEKIKNYFMQLLAGLRIQEE